MKLIEWLVQRPWRYGAERPLPIIGLIRPVAGGPDPLDGIAEWLRSARFTPWARTGTRLVQRPAVLWDEQAGCEDQAGGEDQAAPPPEARAESVTDRPPTVEDLLDVAVKGLAADGAGWRLRFPHYGLALWLVHLRPIQPKSPDKEREAIAGQLQRHLRQRLENTAYLEGLADAVGDFPWWVRLSSRIVPRLGLLFMRGTWRPPRWFARHRLNQAGSFYDMARDFANSEKRCGLTEAERRQRRDVVDQLLVDAFLQDLRVAHRRRSLFGAGRRRTTYPVLLVESDSVQAAQLVRLIEKAGFVPGQRRPGHPRSEPLLVVTNPVTDGSPAPFAPGDARMAYQEWAEEQRHASREGRSTLALRLPVETERPGDWAELGRVGLPRRRLPWMSSVLPLLLVVALVAVPWANGRRCEAWWWPMTGNTLQREKLDSDGTTTQCIGLADDRHRFFAGRPPHADDEVAGKLRAVEELIARTNRKVLEHPHEADRHPVTIVYLSTLTNTTLGGYQAALEELRGLALGQQQALTTQAPILLRLANGGDQMRYGGTAARLIANAADRLNVVAVVGLGVSRRGTEEAIRVLDGERIPTLATLLTADDLNKAVMTYHQIAPSNRREAAVAAFYAKQKLGVAAAAVYYSGDAEDLYSTGLAHDVHQEFEARGIRILERIPYGAGGKDASNLGSRACAEQARARKGRAVPDDYLVFFAGRPDDFENFLSGLSASCERNPPRILAGDAITEFVLSGGLAKHPRLALHYMSPASSRMWGADCAAIRRTELFFIEYEKAGYGDACTEGQAARAMFGWDALETVRTAIVQVRGSSSKAPINGTSLLQGIGMLTGVNAVDGVTGEIDYSGAAGNPWLPANKLMLVMRADAGGGTELELLCATTRVPGHDPGCPSDGVR
ncbi:ABC transporter substrate-binding protein [Actinoplanes derwentensis]|uniref:ABC transporter substrate-binding protein n=1 Tax=Actinoplanes derwentensis TaxID=113562 RepID=UPI000B81D834|nr:ABC transporter substrate-binding protein [Actinoplanes derwentensis]